MSLRLKPSNVFADFQLQSIDNEPFLLLSAAICVSLARRSTVPAYSLTAGKMGHKGSVPFAYIISGGH